MKILANLPLVKKTDSNLPFGKTIQDETDTQEGTPIIADLMQDIFSNLYKLLEITKITPTDAFDSNSTQYQLIDALKKLPNSMNDIERVLTLNGTVWSTDLDLSILPNKYFFFARASEEYNVQETYTFKGIGIPEYSFTSDFFLTGSQLLVIVDTGGVRAYPLAKKEVLVYEAICAQNNTSSPEIYAAFRGENNLFDTFVRISAGLYDLKLTNYTNVLVEVIPMGGAGDDNMNYPKITYSLTGILIDYDTALDCDRDNAFYLRITKKV